MLGWDTFASSVVTRVRYKYQAIEIAVPNGASGATCVVRVHTPYMMGPMRMVDMPEMLARLKERHRARLLRVAAARAAAPEAVTALLNMHFSRSGEGDDRTLANGRALPDEIRALLQEAVDRGLVPARDAGHAPHAGHTPCALDLRAWLKTYGIGVDCGGFVMHALVRLLQDGYAAVGEELDRDARAIVGFVRPGWIYREVTGDPGAAVRFRSVPTPGEARPGDVLTSEGHIRIVLRTAHAPDGSIVMQQVESTSARGAPCGLSEPEVDIGPRTIAVRYPAPERPIAAQMPLRDTDDGPAFATEGGEQAYVLGRLRALRGIEQIF